jgi:hypothetical protein
MFVGNLVLWRGDDVNKMIIDTKEWYLSPFPMEIFIIVYWSIWDQTNDYIFNVKILTVQRYTSGLKSLFSLTVHGASHSLKEGKHGMMPYEFVIPWIGTM